MLSNFKCILEILKSRARWKKELNQVQKQTCLHLAHVLSSYLVSQSLSILLLSPLNIYSGRLYMEVYGKSLVLPRDYKWDVVKTRQASHGLTETRKKGHWKISFYQRGGEESTHTLRYVDMCKWQRVIPRHKGSPRYRIAHGWKDEFGS
jgi:hypothetical protein